MQMRGESITLKSVEETVKERVDEFKARDHDTQKSAFREVVQRVVSIVTRAAPYVVKSMGVLVLVVSSLLLVTLASGLVGAVLRPGMELPGLGVQFQAISGTPEFYALFGSSVLVALVPLLLLMLLGFALLSIRSNLLRRTGYVLLAIWLCSLGGVVAMGIRLAPELRAISKEIEDLPLFSHEITVGTFDAITVDSTYEVTVHQSDQYKVIAHGSQQELDAVSVQRHGSTLEIGTKDGFWFCFPCVTQPMSVDVYLPDLKAVEISGASRVAADDMTLNGLKVEISGASNLNLKSTINKLTGEVSGAGKLAAKESTINSADIAVSGAGRAQLGTVNTLKASASGSGDITYKSVNSLEEDESGAGRVREE
jgi:hypothetical protein